MSYGFMGKLLRVDLSNHDFTTEETNQAWAKKYLGEAGLATKYFCEEVPGGVAPLGLDSKLIFMTGPLTGTASASASRYSVVAKSPQILLTRMVGGKCSFVPCD